MCHLQGDNSTFVHLWYILIGSHICTCLKCLMKVVRKLHLPKIKCKITLGGLATAFGRKDNSVHKRTFEIECILTIWSMWTIFSSTSCSVIQSLSCIHISFKLFLKVLPYLFSLPCIIIIMVICGRKINNFI